MEEKQIKSSLILDISERGYNTHLMIFKEFLDKREFNYTEHTKHEHIFSGELYFFLDKKGVLNNIRKAVPYWATVGDNKQDHRGKYFDVWRSKSESVKRFCENFDDYGYIEDVKECFGEDFGEENVFENKNLPRNAGVKICDITFKKLKKLEKSWKDYTERLSGLFCEDPENIEITVPYKTKREGNTECKLNHIFSIDLFGKDNKVREQRDNILKEYRKIKFGG